jgi:hypothetical protein
LACGVFEKEIDISFFSVHESFNYY